MKKWNWLTLLLVLSLIISGCKDEEVIPPDEVPPKEENPEEPKDKDPYLRFATEALSVGVNGGTFKVKIETNIDWDFSLPPVSTGEQYRIGISGCDFIKKDITEDGYLEIEIAPASAYFMCPSYIEIENKSLNLYACLSIQQEGDPEKLYPTEDVKRFYEITIQSIGMNYAYLVTLETFYTGYKQTNSYPWGELAYKPLSNSNYVNEKAFTYSYESTRTAGDICLIFSKYLEEKNSVWVSFECLFALNYYPLAVLWENVPFVNYMQSSVSQETIISPQSNSKVIFEDLTNRLLNAADFLADYPPGDDPIIVSEEMVRGLLGNMYLYIGKYEKALEQFQRIINKGKYKVEPTIIAAYSNSSQELIYSFPNITEIGYSQYYNYVYETERVPVITYTEVLLAAAECEWQLNNTNAALQYLNQVLVARGYPLITDLNEIKDLLPVWNNELGAAFSYFAFLKRNRLAEDVLDIENYQTRLPIPMVELQLNPNCQQNPGY